MKNPFQHTFLSFFLMGNVFLILREICTNNSTSETLPLRFRTLCNTEFAIQTKKKYSLIYEVFTCNMQLPGNFLHRYEVAIVRKLSKEMRNLGCFRNIFLHTHLLVPNGLKMMIIMPLQLLMLLLMLAAKTCRL